MKCPIEIAQECPLGGRWRKIAWRPAAETMNGATGCGKAARWKSHKPDFPTSLGNPANPAGFPLSHSPDDYGRLMKSNIPFSTKRGHF
jgi:hypothetical protein